MAIIIMDSYHIRLDISIESVANSSCNFFLADWLIVVYIKQRFTAIKHLHRWSAPPQPRMQRCPRPRPRAATISRAGSVAARAAAPVAPEQGDLEHREAALHCVSSKQ